MAWKKRSFTRRRTFKKALARKASHRFDNFAAISIDSCNPLVLSPMGCAREGFTPTPSRLILIDNSVLELQFSDSATVTRLSGKLHFIPFYGGIEGAPPAEDADVRFQELLAAGYHFMGGIRRVEQGVGGESSPTTDAPIAQPLEFDNDFVDIPWLKFHERTHVNLADMGHVLKRVIPGTPFGICADTVAAGAGAPGNTLSNGSGTISIPAISTTCVVQNFPGTVDDPPVMVSDELVINRTFKPFTLNFAMRRKVSLTNKQALVYDFQFHPPVFGTPGPDVGFAVYGKLKAVLRT